MVTRNFYKLFGVMRFSNSGIPSSIGLVRSVYDKIQTPGVISTSITYDHTTNNFPSSGKINLIIGIGTEEENIENYTLTPITSGIRVDSGIESVQTYNDNEIAMYQKTITNISDDEIFVHEIGLVYGYSASNATREPVLLSRTKFDEPIVIAPNETKTFTHKIKI